MIRFFVFIIATVCFFNANAQEILSDVRVTTPKLQTADPKVFESLKEEIEDFINNQKWTDDTFEPVERINCSIQLNILEELSATSFKADLAIQATRPVYGSDYETSLLTHVDRDVTFTYQQYQPINFSRNSFTDNLSSILSYYVYVILGLDYDTFSPLGGEGHFQTAQDIVNTVPKTAGFDGWQSQDGARNRYWILENLLSPRVKDFRQAMYNYHLRSLDIMYRDSEQAKSNLLNVLDVVSKVNKAYPNSMIMQMFANTKSEELIEIFRVADRTQKTKVYQIMSKIDPSRSSNYRGLMR